MLLSILPSHAQAMELVCAYASQVLYFVSAYLMINERNQLAVYAVQAEAR